MRAHGRAQRELVLVGGGHAHVQVIRRWAMAPQPGVRLSVVLDRAEALYSGMVPGVVAGDYGVAECEIDVLPLARRAGARVILAAATEIDARAQRIALVARPALAYDVASLDVGSTVRGLELPGVRELALATRPIRDFVDRLEGALASAAAGRMRARSGAPAAHRDSLRLLVVGAGAAGVELAFTLEARLRARGAPAEVALLTDARELLHGAPGALRRRARLEADARGIRVHAGARVARVEARAVVLESGEALACDLAIWATGAAPIPLFAASALPKDGAGFVRVRDTLQVEGHDALFAAGDCAALTSAPWLPKAGVYAVREGPVLADNLRRVLCGEPLRRYRPQRDFLALLNLGERRALGAKWGVAFRGAHAWRAKDAIDRRFVRRFQVLGTDGMLAPGFPPMPDDASMECGGCAAKVSSRGLASVLAALPASPPDASVVLGLDARDDAAALRTPHGDVLLATVDGFRAFCDDAWLVGRVAALNAVSDVYAKGGTPRHALCWVSVPEGGAEAALGEVLAGVRRELDALGVSLVGGHSTLGRELVVGLAVLGELAEGAAPLTKAGLTPGDALVLTKPLGTGIVLAADMRGRARSVWVQAAHASMLRANANAAAVARGFARACTDVSGFGLAGHLGEMLAASGAGIAAELEVAALPALAGARALLARGMRSSYAAEAAEAAPALLGGDAVTHALACDPQTSGGLLFAVDRAKVADALAALRAAGDTEAAAIGRVVAGAGAIAFR
jgi:selenide,water dikinase